ncbi:MAG: SPL family radical SAM protein [Conexivisphaera sp.]
MWWSRRTAEVRRRRARSVLHEYYDVEDGRRGLTVNPYVGCSHRCVYCYATYEWFERFHDVVEAKVNAPEVLASELAVRRGRRVDPVFLSTATDPYQPVEGVLRLTRRVVEVLQSRGIPYYIYTKSATIVRDLDLHARYRDRCAIVWSLTTVDEKLKRALEPGASSARGVLSAMRRFADAGVLVGVSVDPMIPGVTDDRGKVEELLARARESGASFAYNGVLRLREDIWERLRELLRSMGMSSAVERIERLYYSEGRRLGPYLVPPEDYYSYAAGLVREIAGRLGMRYGIPVGEGEAVAPVERWRDSTLTSYMAGEGAGGAGPLSSSSSSLSERASSVASSMRRPMI